LNPTSLGSRFEVQNSRFRNNFLKLTSLGSRSKMQYSRLKHPWIQFFSSSWILNLEPSPPSIQNLFSRSPWILDPMDLGKGGRQQNCKNPCNFWSLEKPEDLSQKCMQNTENTANVDKRVGLARVCVYIYIIILYIYIYICIIPT
jgi:hypothetical protein